MNRTAFILSMLCFLASFGFTLYSFGAGRYLPGRFNFFSVALGFFFQTVYLYLRGQEVGRCPLTTLFDVLVFLSWSLVLVYMVVGSSYRLSLMGAFTSPLAFLLQLGALLLPPAAETAVLRGPANAWIEMHAALSIIAYGVFALGGVTGIMYLLQQRELKGRKLHSIFYSLPPIRDLAVVNRRLLLFGWGLLTVGLLAGMPAGVLPASGKLWWSLAIWSAYAAILLTRKFHRLGPGGVAMSSVAAFLLTIVSLWEVATRS